MEGLPISPLLIFLVLLVLYVISSIQILNEYERAVVFRLGKLLPQPKGPGVVLVFRPIDRYVRMDRRRFARPLHLCRSPKSRASRIGRSNITTGIEFAARNAISHLG